MGGLKDTLPQSYEPDDKLHQHSLRSIERGIQVSTNPSERRITIYRYGPIWGASRFGYQYALDFLDTLTPAQRRILQPVPPIYPGGADVPQGFAGQKRVS